MNIEKATAIANSLSNATPHASQIIIASVKTSDLVPRAFYPDRSGPALPIWLNKSDMPETSMTDDECSKRCVTIWISVEEVSHHLPRYIGREYDDEWLACGHMLWKDIESVMPYDGVRLYKSPPNRTVRSGGWIFDWGGRRWRLEIASQTLDMIEDGTTETMHDIEKLSDDNEGAKSHTEDLANNHTDELPDTSTIDPSTTGSEHSTTPPSSDLAHLIELCDGTIEALQVCSSQLSELFSAFSMADDRTPDIDAVTTQLRNMNAAVGLVKVVLIEGLSTRTDQDGTDRDLADQDETGGNGSR
ncbi:hypothetical protein K491DRAFT_386754 [Lophiostoma macrostomum CBS 122681]|uniref:Uncharacterized protein n=1 Tax=Lophiostoma macrostomum CBS 122681 TaxID=1314788 RepID=A0A6A6TPS9_9PLEO|nr:hypothetical protein K491DRAFT_386754 [Lophiostoma macrostomum CBS 122681]